MPQPVIAAYRIGGFILVAPLLAGGTHRRTTGHRHKTGASGEHAAIAPVSQSH